MMKLIFLMSLFSFCSCYQNLDKEKMLGNDVMLFKDTPVWQVAKSIARKDTTGIRAFFKKNPSLLEYKEMKYGKTLLNWSVYSFHYEGSKLLCDLGADVNSPAKDGRTAIIYAATNYDTSIFLELLLSYGGDVNYVVRGVKERIDGTPLIAAASTSIENTKLLVEAGANVNYVWGNGVNRNTALSAAFSGGKIEIIHYLILKTDVDYKQPIGQRLNGDSVYIVDELRELPFDLDSKEYKLKMEIVDFLKEKGINYWNAPVPKRFYDLYDKEYLSKY